MQRNAHNMMATPDITPRVDLDFGLDGDIPRYWFDGDVFKTRLFDAMSTLFPEGEKFFIQCVRDFRDRIEDPELLQQTRDFMRHMFNVDGIHGWTRVRMWGRGLWWLYGPGGCTCPYCRTT